MALTGRVGEALQRLAQRSGIPRGELSKRFHRIKRHGATPRATDANWIDDVTGDVYDAPGGQVGDDIGNVFDDF
jgi:hypothetical protein